MGSPPALRSLGNGRKNMPAQEIRNCHPVIAARASEQSRYIQRRTKNGTVMTGWQFLICCAASAWGVLAFLRLVSAEIELTAEDLRLFDEQERRTFEKRQAALAEAEAEAESDIIAETAA